MNKPVLPPYDVELIRRDFPALQLPMNGKPLAFLDSAASAQKPRQVLDAERAFAEASYANVHRGVYALSEGATTRYEAARARVAAFINAAPDEIVFTKGATEAINLVAASWGRSNLRPGDEILLTEAEHHANIVPWQMIAQATGAVVKAARITDDGRLDLENFHSLLGPRTRMVAVAHVSNVLGSVFPVEAVTKAAHAVGAVVLVDGCQGIVHGGVDVAALGCDFYAFSSHKLYGPTGIGVLYGRAALLEDMPPYQGGGDMIERVSFDGTTFAAPPARFEAGTPPIIQAVGLAAAIDYVESLGPARIAAHEAELLTYATQRLSEIEGLRLHGTAPGKRAVLSFTLDDVHPHDIATILDQAGVAVRAGHHCAQPLMGRLGVPATARASLGLYSDRVDIDALIAGLHTVQRLFGA